MKYKFLFSPWLVLFLFPLGITGQVYSDHKVRSYAINEHTTVEVSNKYGKVHILTWDKDSVKFEVDLRISTNNYQKTQKIKDNIQFEFSATNYYIVARTNFLNSTGVISDLVDAFVPSNQVVINYMVYLPKTVALKVENKFGDIYIDDFSGDLEINLANGDLKANKLSGSPVVHLNSGNGTINSIDGTVYTSYSDLRIRQSNKLIIDSRSSNIVIDKVDYIKMVSRRDKYSIESARIISADGYFTAINVEALSKEINARLKYGNISIDQVNDNFSFLNIDSEYTDIDLFFNRNASYLIDIVHHNETYINLPANLAKIQTKDINPEEKLKLTYGKIGSSANETSHKLKINAPKKCVINIIHRD